MKPALAAILATPAIGYDEAGVGAVAFSMYAALSRARGIKAAQYASEIDWRTRSLPQLASATVFCNADLSALDNPYRRASRASDLTFDLGD